MDNCCDFVRLIRKIAFFTLVGLAVVFLTGPVLAVLSFVISAVLVALFVLLPLVLVGLAVSLPIKAIYGCRAGADHALIKTARFIQQVAYVLPARTCGHICSKARGLSDHIHNLTCFIGTIFVETVSGALVGALLGAIAGFQSQTLQLSIPAGSIIGAGLGIIVGASRVRAPQPALSSQTSDGVR